MFIVDSFVDKGKYYAACSGQGITKDMTCNAVQINEKTYPVRSVYIRESFSGFLQAMLEMNGPILLPHGEAKAI